MLTGWSKGAFLPPLAQMFEPWNPPQFQNPPDGVFTFNTSWPSTVVLIEKSIVFVKERITPISYLHAIDLSFSIIYASTKSHVYILRDPNFSFINLIELPKECFKIHIIIWKSWLLQNIRIKLFRYFLCLTKDDLRYFNEIPRHTNLRQLDVLGFTNNSKPKNIKKK